MLESSVGRASTFRKSRTGRSGAALEGRPTSHLSKPEYDLRVFENGVRGKYYRRAMAGTNLVLIEPDLMSVFPDTEAVNRAVRLLVQTAKAAGKPSRSGRRSSR